MDVARLVGAVTREISTREVDGKPARVVVASRTYDTSREDLWDAITTPQRLSRWMGPVTGELRLGGRFSVENNASGQIVECEPPERLRVTWEFQGDTSWVSLRLTSQSAESTELQLEHVAHVPEEFWDEYGPGATGVGWELALAGLESVVSERPDGMPLGDEAAVFGSAEGKAFVARSSEAWGEASVAGGTAEDAARAAAQRTTAFYSG